MPSGHPYDWTGQGSRTDLQSVISPVTVANTTSKTLLHPGVPTPAPAFTAPGSTFRVDGWGQYSDTGTPTLAFTLQIGATVIAAIPAITLGSGVSAVPYQFEAELEFITATTATGYFSLTLGTSSSTDASSTYINAPTSPVSVAAADQGGQAAAFVTWSAASASNTISLLGGYAAQL